MNKTYEQALGEIMKYCRLNVQMTQEQAGKAIGKTKYVVHRLESAKHRTNDETVKALCKVYGIDYITTMKCVYEIMNIDFDDCYKKCRKIQADRMRYYRCLNAMSIEEASKKSKISITKIKNYESAKDLNENVEIELCKLYHVLRTKFTREYEMDMGIL